MKSHFSNWKTILHFSNWETISHFSNWKTNSYIPNWKTIGTRPPTFQIWRTAYIFIIGRATIFIAVTKLWNKGFNWVCFEFVFIIDLGIFCNCYGFICIISAMRLQVSLQYFDSRLASMVIGYLLSLQTIPALVLAS